MVRLTVARPEPSILSQISISLSPQPANSDKAASISVAKRRRQHIRVLISIMALLYPIPVFRATCRKQIIGERSRKVTALIASGYPRRANLWDKPILAVSIPVGTASGTFCQIPV